jgi:hypothetical protein
MCELEERWSITNHFLDDCSLSLFLRTTFSNAIKRFWTLINFDLAGHVDEPLELLGVVGLRLGLAWHGRIIFLSASEHEMTKSPPAIADTLSGLEVAAKSIAGKLLGVIHDLIPSLLQEAGADFIKASYVPVNGTKDILIAFEVDPVVFDTQLRAALRARGFDLPNRNGVHVRS